MTRPRPGPTDSIVDVPGVRVGQVSIGAGPETPNGSTGVTAVVVRSGALGAIDVRGGAPGTRESETLAATRSGERVHAVLLVGRSVFGLAAADGATNELEERGIGIVVEREEGRLVFPIVPAAVIFDALHGDPAIRPSAEEGRRAVAAALDGSGAEPARPASGTAGAGTGASIGGLVGDRRKGGVGHASLAVVTGAHGAGQGRRLIVGALVVVNSAGGPARRGRHALLDPRRRPRPIPAFETISSSRGQTTLAVIATNARLSKAQLAHVATMAHDGFARAIEPVHTGVDGDLAICLAIPDGDDAPAVDVHEWPPAATSIVGAMAADAVERAIADALRSATASGGLEPI